MKALKKEGWVLKQAISAFVIVKLYSFCLGITYIITRLHHPYIEVYRLSDYSIGVCTY